MRLRKTKQKESPYLYQLALAAILLLPTSLFDLEQQGHYTAITWRGEEVEASVAGGPLQRLVFPEGDCGVLLNV